MPTKQLQQQADDEWICNQLDEIEKLAGELSYGCRHGMVKLRQRLALQTIMIRELMPIIARLAIAGGLKMESTPWPVKAPRVRQVLKFPTSA